MCCVKILLVLSVLLLNKIENASSQSKYAYQKDVSEYCRRRVMPSVFIGNQIVEAHSKILHFSQLEVPYSCFVSIRTELGNNIILVLQINHDEPMEKVCENKQSPVRVYEMGETFGGYWGAIPDSMMVAKPATLKYYTMHRSPTPDENNIFLAEAGSNTDTTDYEETEASTTVKPQSHMSTEDEGDFTEIELMNVSARLVPGTLPYTINPFSIDETFDAVYDVTQRPGVKYDTALIPIAQFNIREEDYHDQHDTRKDAALRKGVSEDDEAQNGSSSTEMRYRLDYEIGGFTIDPRLTFSYKRQTIKNKNRNYMKKFKKPKNNVHFVPAGTTYKPYKKQITTKSTKLTSNGTTNSWSRIEALLKNLTQNESDELKAQKASENEKFSRLVQNLDEWKHNYSAYLSPNLFEGKNLDNILGILQSTESRVNKMNTVKSTETSAPEIESMVTNVITSTTRHSKLNTDNDDFKMSLDTTPAMTIDQNKTLNTESTLMTDILGATTTEAVTTGITELLTTTATEVTDKTQDKERITKQESDTVRPPLHMVFSSVKPATNVISTHAREHTVATQTWHTTRAAGIRRRRKNRKKRAIEQIKIHDAKPHSLITRPDVATTQEAMFRFSDIQDFARLVELRDDELHGHIPLLNMRRYVDAKLFDLCNNATAVKHVYLFNTSRIVLAISNFSLRHMHVIVTPARTLTRPEMVCPNVSLECQVSGARVCVDKITACDGIPHCGSLDIYDEDRLLCGKSQDQHHNVYLAAFTLLLVLLTMAYTVHYWLKRCVPKVSEAFFIYTDGIENTLRLKSIMKSPIDTTAGEENIITIPQKNYLLCDLDITARTYKSKITALKNLFNFRRKKKKDEFDFSFADRSKFSFAEIEIGKLTHYMIERVDEGVQTGESLEMENVSNILGTMTYEDSFVAVRTRKESVEPRHEFTDLRFNMTEEEAARRSTDDSELMVLQFLKDARVSVQRNVDDVMPPRAELPNEQSVQERRSGSSAAIYDPSLFLFSTISPDPSLTSNTERKHEPTSMKLASSEVPSYEELGTSAMPTKRLRFQDNSHDRDVDAAGREPCVADPDPESSGAGGAARDFMRFWGSKTRKPKKK